MKSIVILIDYFGHWPKWFPVFLSSCAFNKTINWIIRTDCKIPKDSPENVRFISISYRDYVTMVSQLLSIDFNPIGNYKICDLRPMFGDMYKDDIMNFDYYGFGDIDVIYGDIRRFYTDEVLSFDIISTHVGMLSGHLVLFKNTELMRKAYCKILNWKEYAKNPESTRFDEDVFSRLFFRQQEPNEIAPIYSENVYSKEQYSTVFHPMPWHDGMPDHPDIWFWKNGVITNNRNIGRQYLYLHLMNFQSMRWANPACRKHYVPWKDNPETVYISAETKYESVRIGWEGIQSLVNDLDV